MSPVQYGPLGGDYCFIPESVNLNHKEIADAPEARWVLNAKHLVAIRRIDNCIGIGRLVCKHLRFFRMQVD